MVHISDETVDEVRYVVQRILVPIVFIVGLLGNSVSIYVLTRKRMRCTTNIYLTALAITDNFYLALCLTLSFQHYQYTRINVKFYWHLYGAFAWLCDACAYISIYIAVCFTIERFIAIRYPLKRQTFCTESLAKKVIAGVVVFCILSTLSTLFEHQPRVVYRLLDEQGKPCIVNFGANSLVPRKAKHIGNSLDFQNYMEGSGSDFAMENVEEAMNRLKRSLQPDPVEATMTSMNIPPATTPTSFTEQPGFLINDVGSGLAPSIPTAIYWGNEQKQKMLALDLLLANFNEDCKNVTYYSDSPGILGNNDLYENIWSYLSSIVYVLMPLTVLATFNCFLVVMVRRSNTLRGKMTNASSMRRPKDKGGSTSVSQENRVTITLIAVVVCFIIFQLPWAAYLIVALRVPDMERNLRLVCGNVFNLLAALNCTTNFFLYCLLSDKYRKTVRELLTGKSSRRERGNLTTTSIMTNNTSRCSYRPAPTSPPPGIKRAATGPRKGL